MGRRGGEEWEGRANAGARNMDVGDEGRGGADGQGRVLRRVQDWGGLSRSMVLLFHLCLSDVAGCGRRPLARFTDS